jgi:hypothetical protein
VAVARPKNGNQKIAPAPDQDLGAERKILEEFIRLQPDRPVYTAIRTAFIQVFAEYYSLLRRAEGPVSPDRLARLDKEWTQLAGLLFNRSNVWAARDWRKPPILKFLLRAIGRTPGGRPVTRRHIAVQAKEMRLADPKRWTWPKLRDELCDCGKSEHDIRCQDNLRREVAHLEKLLSKFGHTI